MKTVIGLLLTIILFSCNQGADKTTTEVQLSEENESIQTNTAYEHEKFVAINPDEINQLLKGKNEDLSAQDVIKLYYPNEINSGEGNEKIEITEKNSENGNTLVTLIHDNLLDDSQRGEKYIMELKRVKNKWTVVSIKKNWKCWDGRGHTDWGIELCE